MTVSTASYTTNSKKITITNELSSSNVISSVDAAIVALGWTQYDVLTGHVPGTGSTSAFSPINTYVYRAINYDNSTYKYLIIRWDIIKRYFVTSTCESWNSTTHVPTNESWSNNGAFIQGYDLKDSFIWIGASNRHFVIWTFIKNQPGIWTMVCEMQRVSEEDTVGNNSPCWAWTNSLMIGTPFGQTASTSTSKIMFAFPRTFDNSTGSAAAQVYATCSNRGMYPPSYPSGTVSITVDTNLLHLGSAYNIPYAWDSSSILLAPVYVDAISKSMRLGNIYSMGVTGNIGNNLDTITVKLNAAGGWPDGTGSSSSAVLLPMHGGWDGDGGYSSVKASNFYTQTDTIVVSKMEPVGNLVLFLAASDGVRRWDAKMGQGSYSSLLYSDSGGIYDVVFDGERSVYASTSTGVIKIDTETLGQSTVAITGGTGYLSIDAKYVYATDRALSTAPKCSMILRSNFTVNASPYTLSTTLLSAAGNWVTPQSDYNGSVYMRNSCANGASQTFRCTKFTADTGVQLFNVSDPIYNTAQTLTVSVVGNYMLDITSGSMFFIIFRRSNEGGTALYTVNSSLVFTLIGTGMSGVWLAVINPQWSPSTTANHRGDNFITPMRGLWSIQNKAPGTTSFGQTHRAFFFTPGTNLPSSPITPSGSSIVTYPQAGCSWLTTDGINYYSPITMSATDNRLYVMSKLYDRYPINGGATGRIVIEG